MTEPAPMAVSATPRRLSVLAPTTPANCSRLLDDGVQSASLLMLTVGGLAPLARRQGLLDADFETAIWGIAMHCLGGIRAAAGVRLLPGMGDAVTAAAEPGCRFGRESAHHAALDACKAVWAAAVAPVSRGHLRAGRFVPLDTRPDDLIYHGPEALGSHARAVQRSVMRANRDDWNELAAAVRVEAFKAGFGPARREVPRFDAVTRKLEARETSHAFHSRATAIVPMLAAFQTAGWPDGGVEVPGCSMPCDVAKALCRALGEAFPVKFHAMGNGRLIGWSWSRAE